MPAARRSRMTDATTAICARWRSPIVPVNRSAVAGDQHDVRGEDRQVLLEGVRPLEGPGVRPEAGWPGLLDEIAQKGDPAVGHEDRRVAVGVPATGIPKQCHPVAQVNHRAGGECRVWFAYRRGEQVGDVGSQVAMVGGVAGVGASRCLDPPRMRVQRGSGVVVGVDGGALEGDVAEGVVEVHVGVDHLAHSFGPGHRRHIPKHLGPGRSTRSGVDHQCPSRTHDQPDVDVPLGVPRHIDPVGDLGEGASRHIETVCRDGLAVRCGRLVRKFDGVRVTWGCAGLVPIAGRCRCLAAAGRPGRWWRTAVATVGLPNRPATSRPPAWSRSGRRPELFETTST